MTGDQPAAAGELSLRCGPLEVVVHAVGATVRAIRAGGVDLAPQLAAAGAYLGSTMGRFARIVPGGELVIDGRAYQLDRNAGRHHIHGGPVGFDAREWRDGGGSGIRLELVSPDGDQGYPGRLTATASFELAPGRLAVTFEASTDAPTLCGLSTHIFWNLAGAGSIDEHLLQLDATGVVEADEEFVPTGRVVPVPPELDFATPRRLGGTVVDRFFAATGARLAAAGRALRVSSTASGMAVYTGDGLPRPRAGICLQPGPWPYHPDLPSSVLRPGERYRCRTVFELSGSGTT